MNFTRLKIRFAQLKINFAQLESLILRNFTKFCKIWQNLAKFISQNYAKFYKGIIKDCIVQNVESSQNF